MALPDIFGVLTAIRDRVGAFYDDASIPLPARRLVTPGLPAFDCEQFTVTAMSSYNVSGPISTSVYEQRTAAVGFDLRTLIIDLTVVRCMAVLGDSGKAPTVAQIEADAEAVAVDEVALRAAVDVAVADGTLPAFTNVAMDQWTAIPPLGGYGGSTLRIRLIP
jgi:hypothetical protein